MIYFEQKKSEPSHKKLMKKNHNHDNHSNAVALENIKLSK